MRKLLGIIAVAGAIVALAAPAQARLAQPEERLRLEAHDTASAGWQRHVSDSPADKGQQRVKLAVAEQSGDDYVVVRAPRTGVRGPIDKGQQRVKLAVADTIDNNDYVVVRAPRTGVRGPIDEVGHLGFDVLTKNYVGAGAPRISVDIDTDGDAEADLYAYLSAAYCQRNYAGSDWARANFTHRVAVGCKFYTSEVGTPSYESTGTKSAWDVFADAHPSAKVLAAYMVMDEVGQSFVDRIVIGNRLFPSANQVVVLA
jgi:hypothetical protein